MSADCINTQSTQGRNATPLPLIDAVHYVFGGTRSPGQSGIELDPCSDSVINREVMAIHHYNFLDDGLQNDWWAKTLWMNPPGSTVTGGSLEDRRYWEYQLSRPIHKRGIVPDLKTTNIQI